MNAMLEGKSVQELDVIIREAQQAKEIKRQQGIKAAFDQLKQSAVDLGVTIDEILAIGSVKLTKPNKAPVVAKYVNPENPSETWTGRGMTPRWMTAAIKLGKKKEDFLIASSSV